MREQKIGSLVLEGGSSMFYFTGMRLSEGALVMPAEGDPVWVVPGNVASSLRGDVRVWKDEQYKPLVQALKGTRIAIEERVRFAVYDGLRKETPALEFVSGDPVTVACRVIKSPAEIALMQRANDITIAAYKAAFATLHEGMTQRELGANISAAYRALGAPGFAMVSFGKYTAFPHGATGVESSGRGHHAAGRRGSRRAVTMGLVGERKLDEFPPLACRHLLLSQPFPAAQEDAVVTYWYRTAPGPASYTIS